MLGGMRHVIGVILCAMAGCSGLYEKPAAPLANPRKVPAPKTAEIQAAAIVWDESCPTFFHEPPVVAVSRPDAELLVARARDTVAQATVAKPDQRGALIVRAIEEDKRALGKDPYSAEATYHLAVVYAQLHKKKCALDLINRLVALRGHPRYRADAKRLIDAAYDEPAFVPLRAHLP